MAVRHKDVGVRTLREYFIESVKRLMECYRVKNGGLKRFPVLDELATSKYF